MTFTARLLVVALSTYAAVSVLGAIVAILRARRRQPTEPRSRATACFSDRLLPAVLGAAAAVPATVAFFLFEPRSEPEATGMLLNSLAVGSLLLVLSGAWRLLGIARLTRQTLAAWMPSAEHVEVEGTRLPVLAVDAPFPVVAVVGIIRPRLVIARTVLLHCLPAELTAILAHEHHHVARRDNLSRLLMAVSPDPLAWSRTGRRLAAAWHDAAEESADDAAGRAGPEGRLRLAEALIRVARLAPEGLAARALPASALYRGEDLARRVRRLLEPAPPVDRRRPRRHAAVTALACGAVALVLESIYALVEAAVTFLP